MNVPEQYNHFPSANSTGQPPSYSKSIPSYHKDTQNSSSNPSDAKQHPCAANEKHSPPPSYDDLPESSRIASQRPLSTTSAPACQPTQPLRFPPQFNVYMHFSTFTLGPHKDSKLFTIIQTGLRKPLTLIQGPDKNAPALATLKMKGLGATSLLTILPHEGGEIDKPLEITIENHSFYHSFCISLPNQPPRFFEWRSSKSNEVKTLGSYKRGWKLVWLHSNDRDDNEIVAASGLNNSFSVSKGLKFGFFNSGLDGTLGDTFAIAAVATAVSDFEVFVSK